jgi:hypothetical protein
MSCTPDNILYKGNDHDVGIPALTSRDTGDPLTGATVTAQLFQSDYTTAIGSAVTLTETVGDDGEAKYDGVIESSVFSGQSIDADVLCKHTVVKAGENAEWWTELVVGYRRPGE